MAKAETRDELEPGMSSIIETTNREFGAPNLSEEALQEKRLNDVKLAKNVAVLCETIIRLEKMSECHSDYNLGYLSYRVTVKISPGVVEYEVLHR